MSALRKLLGVSEVDKTYVDDVFSAYTYLGNGTTQTINNGIDLAGKGGMVWTKRRDSPSNGSHLLVDSVRGTGNYLVGDSTQSSVLNTNTVSGFNANGFSIGSAGFINTEGALWASWTFRNAKDFFQVLSVTKSAGSNLVIDLSPYFPSSAIGKVKVKRTEATGSWYTWHRSLSTGKLLIGETTAAEATMGHITVVGTTLTLVNGVIADGTYHVEAYAHDTSADGLIQCGSFTTDGSGKAAVTLGWEPQFLITKSVISTTSPWPMLDSMRGWTDGSTDNRLFADVSNAESTASNTGSPLATGFSVQSYEASQQHIYLAIRRPNKPPTTGTQVYNAIARGTGAGLITAGFPPDLWWTKARNSSSNSNIVDRLRGSNVQLSATDTAYETAYTYPKFTQNGVDGAAGGVFGPGYTEINHFFRRAPGVMDQICYGGTATNKTEAHNLAAVAELWLVKGRLGATQWVWGSSLLAATEKIVMPSPAGKVTDATAWNSTYPTASAISLGTAAAVNTSGATYTLYMWATLAGVSKVGTYTGDGAAGKVINCGFAAGARFVMIIRATAAIAQDIFIFDTVRGIVAGNDPHLSLNTTATEVTTDDSIDTDSSGFIVNQVAATNINVSGAVYLYLAYA